MAAHALRNAWIDPLHNLARTRYALTPGRLTPDSTDGANVPTPQPIYERLEVHGHVYRQPYMYMYRSHQYGWGVTRNTPSPPPLAMTEFGTKTCVVLGE